MTPNGFSLAPHAHRWIGGDIDGLRDVAERLQGYIPHVQDLVGQLSVTVRDLTGDRTGGWQGTAADAFTMTWSRQVAAARALQDYVTAAAQAIGSLAVELSQIESALENEAFLAARHGVRVGGNGDVAGYAGVAGLETALEYRKVYTQAQAEAEQAREAAAQQLDSLYQQVFNPNPHFNGADANTGAALLADLAAAPTAYRREVASDLKKLRGRELNLREEIAESVKNDGSIPQDVQARASKVEDELLGIQKELAQTAKTENALTRALDTRSSDVAGYLAGHAGPGRHVAGNTAKDLQSAARDGEPTALEKAIEIGNDIPVVDVVSTLAGIGIGTYSDVQQGQDPGSALRDEVISNALETGAGTATGEVVGTELGARIGAAGGPIGLVAGTAAGYVIGDFSHDALIEPWGQDIKAHGVASGILYGTGHSEVEVGDDIRDLGIAGGHAVEHLWDEATGRDLPEHKILRPRDHEPELIRADPAVTGGQAEGALSEQPGTGRTRLACRDGQFQPHCIQFARKHVLLVQRARNVPGHQPGLAPRPQFGLQPAVRRAPCADAHRRERHAVMRGQTGGEPGHSVPHGFRGQVRSCVHPGLQRLIKNPSLRVREAPQPHGQALHQPERRIRLLGALAVNIRPVVRLGPRRLRHEESGTRPAEDPGLGSDVRLHRVPARQVDLVDAVHVDAAPRRRPRLGVEQPHALQHPLGPRVGRQEEPYVAPLQPVHQVLPGSSGEKRHPVIPPQPQAARRDTVTRGTARSSSDQLRGSLPSPDRAASSLSTVFMRPIAFPMSASAAAMPSSRSSPPHGSHGPPPSCPRPLRTSSR